jgi:carboxyl-terminal processing protease
MKNIKSLCFVLSILLSLTACKKMWLGNEPANNPVENFESFWQGMNENYVGLSARPDIDWDSIYRVYRPRVTDATTNSELFSIFKNMMNGFKDEHFVLEGNNTNSGYFQYADTFNHQYLGFTVVRDYATASFKGNKTVQYAPMGKVGYINIQDFNGSNPQANYEIIDGILEEFKDQTGIIVDIRDNGGGNEAYAKIIASRFTDQSHIYEYDRFKNGKKRSDLSDFIGKSFASHSDKPFLKPVMLLTNQQNGSTAENFALMMRSLPHVKIVGDNTAGLIYTRPITRQLPNGWLYWCSVALLHDTNKKVLINGLEPDFRVTISSNDASQRKDRVLEKAIDLLK